MLINSPDCSTCLFSWYGLLTMVGCVGGEQSDPQTPKISVSTDNNNVIIIHF